MTLTISSNSSNFEYTSTSNSDINNSEISSEQQQEEIVQQSSQSKSLLQKYTDKLNNTILTISNLIREIKFHHHNKQLMKRRRMLQKRQVVNHAKAVHQRKKQIQIESQKAAIREYFNKV